MKKRILSLLLTLCLVVGMLPGTSLSASAADTHSHDTAWTATEGEVTAGSYYLTGAVTATGNLTVPRGATVTLCLNGQTLDMGEGELYVDEGATLNICSCAVEGKLIGSGYRVIHSYCGTVSITSGTVECTGSDGYAIYSDNGNSLRVSGTAAVSSTSDGIRVYNTTVEVSGGTVSASGEYSCPLSINGNSIVTVSGGKISGTKYGINCSDTSTLNLTGGEISVGESDGSSAISTSNSATVNISGGEISGRQGIYAGYGKINISGGKFVCTYASVCGYRSAEITITDGQFSGDYAVYVYSSYGYIPTVNISGGTFHGGTGTYCCGLYNDGAKVSISGGSFTGYAGFRNVDDAEVTVSGGSFTGEQLGIYNQADADITISAADAPVTMAGTRGAYTGNMNITANQLKVGTDASGEGATVWNGLSSLSNYAYILAEKVPDRYIVAGVAELCGSSWAPTDAKNLMTQEGDVYKIVYPNVAVNENYQLKVVRNGIGWIGDAKGNNICFKVNSACDVTVTYDPATGKITVSGDGVELITELEVTAMYAVGNGNGPWLNGVQWDPVNERNMMTELSEGVYQIAYTNVPSGSYQVKFAANGSLADNWGGVFTGSGVETAAEYNSQNSIDFEVTYDLAKVTLKLDLSGYDHMTREGAKFTVTVKTVEEVFSHTHTDGTAFDTCWSGEVEGYGFTSSIHNIVLTGDTTLGGNMNVSGDATVNLCLNGCALTNVHAYVNSGATLNIYDCSEGKTGTMTGTALETIAVAKGGTVNLYGGTVQNTKTDARYYYAVENSGTVNVYGGTLTAVGGHTLDNQSGGIVNISGGKVEHTGSEANAEVIYNNAGSTLNISGGTVTGSNRDSAIWNSGSVTISGGTVENLNCTGSGQNTICCASGSALTISGGTVSGSSEYVIRIFSNAAVTITGGNVTGTGTHLVYNSGNLTVSDGSLSGTTEYGLYNSGGTAAVSGGSLSGARYAIYLRSDGAVDLSGGSVSSTDYLTIWLIDGSLYLSGSPTLENTGTDALNDAKILQYISDGAKVYGHAMGNEDAKYEGEPLTIGCATTEYAIGAVMVYGCTDVSRFVLDSSTYILGSDGSNLVLQSSHVHNWGSNWYYDETTHWHNCSASGCYITENSQKDGYGAHSYPVDDGDCTTAVACETCGYVLVAACEHSFTDADDTTCDNEGCTYTHTRPADDGDCTTPVICETCGYVFVDADYHSFTDGEDTTCNNEGCTHVRTTVEHEGEQYFAVNDSSLSDGKYVLTADWNSGLLVSGDVTLCLNGHNVWMENAGIFVAPGATLTLRNCGETHLDETAMENSKGLVVGGYSAVVTDEGATLILEGGYLRGGSYGIDDMGGTVIVNGGTVWGSDYGIYSESYYGYGKITVNGGTIIGNTDDGIYIINGELTVKDGTVIGDDEGIDSDSSTIVIAGGTIIAEKREGIDSRNDTITVNGGTITAEEEGIDGSGSTVIINGGTITGGEDEGVDIYEGTVTIYNGTIIGGAYDNHTNDGIYGYSSEITIHGGTVSGDDCGVNSDLSTTIITGGTVTGSTAAIYDYDNGSYIYLSGSPILNGTVWYSPNTSFYAYAENTEGVQTAYAGGSVSLYLDTTDTTAWADKIVVYGSEDVVKFTLANPESFEGYSLCPKEGNLVLMAHTHTGELLYTSNNDGTHTVRYATCQHIAYAAESCDYVDGVCSKCDHDTNHYCGNGTKHEATPANCKTQTDGNILYYECSCGKKYDNEACTGSELTDVTVPWEHSGGTATCQTKKECAVCGAEYGDIDPDAHSYIYTLTEDDSSQKITETCANGCDHIAYVALTENDGLEYTGQPLMPVSLITDGTFDGVEQLTLDDVVYSQNGETVANVINAGTYTASIAVGGKTASVEITVSKASVIVPSIDSKVYNGQQQTADIQNTQYYSVTTNNGGTDAGEYDVVLTLKDSANYKWSDGTVTAAITLKFSITKSNSTVSGSDATATYGDEITLSVHVALPSVSTFSFYPAEDQVSFYCGETLLGTVNVVNETATLEYDTTKGGIPTGSQQIITVYYGGSNDLEQTIGTLNATVNKAQLTKPTADTATFTYTGREQTYTMAEDARYTISGNKRTDAGSQTVTVSLKDKNNYQWTDSSVDDLTFTFTIEQKDISGANIVLGDSLTYNGNEQTQTVAGVVIDGLTVTYDVSGNTATNAGTNDYTLTVTGTGNFKGTATKAWNISKATPVLTITPSDASLSGGGKVELTVTGVPAEGTYEITCAPAIAANADGSYTLPNKTEVYTFTVSYAESANYNAATATCTVSVTKYTYIPPMPNYYTLTFDTNGGTPVDAVKNIYGGSTVDLSKCTTTREGYVFNGWYSDAALRNEITSIRMTKNTTVYAGWTKITEPFVNPFKDVFASDWYYGDVMYVYEHGLMEGTAVDLFSPAMTTTRGMIVTILYRLEGKPSTAGLDNLFTDLKQNWYIDAVKWAAANDIVEGYGNGLYGPEDPITREQMVTILWRYAKYKGVDVSEGEDTNILSYKDVFDISEYAIPAMQWAVAEGIIQGDQGYLTPKASAPRCQIAAILHRYCLLIKE